MPAKKKKKTKKKPPKKWVYVGQEKASSKISEEEKKRVQDAFVKVVGEFKEEYVEKKPPNHNFNYIIDIKSKWYRNYFYLYSIYKCPQPNALSDTFESPFARLEYISNDKFNLAYMRHTKKWLELFTDLTLEVCIESICEQPFFQP